MAGNAAREPGWSSNTTAAHQATSPQKAGGGGALSPPSTRMSLAASSVAPWESLPERVLVPSSTPRFHQLKWALEEEGKDGGCLPAPREPPLALHPPSQPPPHMGKGGGSSLPSRAFGFGG